MATSADDEVFPLNFDELIEQEKRDVVSTLIPKKKSLKKHSAKSNSKSNDTINEIIFSRNISRIYFENSHHGPNLLSIMDYTGPCNSNHLQRKLYLPILCMEKRRPTKIHFERFLNEYQQVIQILEEKSSKLKVTVYLRFGILYLNTFDSSLEQPISINDYCYYRNRGRKIKSSFYTCKGVTSPKKLVQGLMKMNYEKVGSNDFTYDIQLLSVKRSNGQILHLQYNDKLQCIAALFRPNYPINFDFVRDKTVSRCQSIDDSYLDMFDFRVQLTQSEFLQRTDPFVLEFLRGVPIDEVLTLDKSTNLLEVSPKLHRYVKYLKYTHSDNYRNFDEDILISIGTYEEYQLDAQGVCQPWMKAENIMTIELLSQKNHSPDKLYELGMWFSNLCQSCVDLSINVKNKQESSKACRWFSEIPAFAKKSKATISENNAYRLTTYKLRNQKHTYTTEDFNIVRKILHHENSKDMFLLITDKKSFTDRTELEENFQVLRKRLSQSAVPGAARALIKVQEAFQEILDELDQKFPDHTQE